VPLPVVIVPEGDLVNIHDPVEGSSLITMLPVSVLQVGWVIVSMTGTDGVSGWLFITTLTVDAEVHPSEFVTVKVYVIPSVSSVIVVLVPVPVFVAPPGVAVIVHVPVAGKPFRITLPVATEHVGWVIVPMVGAEGVIG